MFNSVANSGSGASGSRHLDLYEKAVFVSEQQQAPQDAPWNKLLNSLKRRQRLAHPTEVGVNESVKNPGVSTKEGI